MEGLPSAAVADACVRLSIPLRVLHVPSQIPGHLSGRALAVSHHGSVDVFLEAISESQAGDVLVIDNQGRKDEGCIGDLTALEAKLAGIQGIIVWGRHRDHEELQRLALPTYSLGRCPAGPTSTAGRAAHVGTADVDGVQVASGDWVVADEDGIVVVPATHWTDVAREAHGIAAKERQQAALMQAGTSLRTQLRFRDYLERRRTDPTYTLRRHLRDVDAAIEA